MSRGDSMDKTKFKPKKRRAEMLDKLSADIAEKLGIEEKILQKTSKKAIKRWEKATRVKTVNLFRSEPHHVSSIIPHLLTYFETEYTPIVESSNDLNIALDL